MTTLVANVPPIKVWAPIPGYEGLYEASSSGEIRSVPRVVQGRFGATKRKEHLLKQHLNRNKKYCVRLSKNGVKKNFEVAVLIAAAFLGPRPLNMCVLHGPRGGMDNTLENLSYGTYSKNAGEDRKRDGTLPQKERHPNAKRTLEEIQQIKISYSNGETQVSIAKKLGTSQGYVSNVITGKIW